MFEPVDKFAVDMQGAFNAVPRSRCAQGCGRVRLLLCWKVCSRPSLQAVPEPFFQPLHRGRSIFDEPVLDVLRRGINQPLEVLFGALFQFGWELLFFVGGEPLVEPLFEQAVVFGFFE